MKRKKKSYRDSGYIMSRNNRLYSGGSYRVAGSIAKHIALQHGGEEDRSPSTSCGPVLRLSGWLASSEDLFAQPVLPLHSLLVRLHLLTYLLLLLLLLFSGIISRCFVRVTCLEIIGEGIFLIF